MTIESHAARGLLAGLPRRRNAGAEERQSAALLDSLRAADKGDAFFGPKHASHPINAMLNYCYIVEAGRLAKALAAQGLALPIGYLHSDKKGRNSLVWDAIEPLRPCDRRQGVRVRRGARVRAARLSAVRLQRASPVARRDAAAVAQGVAAVARDRGDYIVDAKDDHALRRGIAGEDWLGRERGEEGRRELRTSAKPPADQGKRVRTWGKH